MLKVGLTGGYATGKSLVAHELERLGCHIIYADVLGHRVLFPDGEAYAPVLAEFGTGILDEENRIDRKKLANIVFGDAARLNQLSGIVHPAVFRLEAQMLQQIAGEDPRGIAVIEAAILIETERDKWFDRIILTACEEEAQVARGMKRDNITRAQVLARLANQMPLAEKRKHADYVVDTSGTKDDTMHQVEEIYGQLARLARERAE